MDFLLEDFINQEMTAMSSVICFSVIHLTSFRTLKNNNENKEENRTEDTFLYSEMKMANQLLKYYDTFYYKAMKETQHQIQSSLSS